MEFLTGLRCWLSMFIGLGLGFLLWIPAFAAMAIYGSVWLSLRLDLHVRAFTMTAGETVKVGSINSLSGGLAVSETVIRDAIIDLPDPGAPVIRRWCRPAAAISSARFARSCPLTSERSRLGPSSACTSPGAAGAKGEAARKQGTLRLANLAQDLPRFRAKLGQGAAKRLSSPQVAASAKSNAICPARQRGSLEKDFGRSRLQ